MVYREMTAQKRKDGSQAWRTYDPMNHGESEGESLFPDIVYHTPGEKSSNPSPMTGTAIDGTITLCGMSISDMPILVSKALTKLWFYEHNEI